MTIIQRLALVNAGVGSIEKSQRNQQQNFKFRGIDQVLSELHSLFAKHEIVITQKVLSEKREERLSKVGGTLIWSIVTYEFTFNAPDGSTLSTQMIGEAMDSGDKGNNKCVSIALKYALINMFTIPTEEQKEIDPDRFSVEVGKPETKPVTNLTRPCTIHRVNMTERISKDGKPYFAHQTTDGLCFGKEQKGTIQ